MLLLLFATLLVGIVQGNDPIVKTQFGLIKGYYKLSQNGRQYQAFEGIPYALPPTGKLRFKAPHQTHPWLGVLSATKLSDICIQYSPFKQEDRVQGSEDCLYLNIYAPIREDKSQLLPVIFWIHGGGFQYGSGTEYGAKYLADRDVILVTFNYRLGPLGFLSTEDEIVPGNMGLKDQSMALHWVSNNIKNFGGNPKKLSLFGLSAGGASVHYHYLSPMSFGLFQNGVSFSGTALDCWAQTENALEKAIKLGTLMGCPTQDILIMVRCLRFRPVKALVQAVSEFMPWLYNPFTPFGPVVEKAGSTPFIDRSPTEITSSGDAQDVPWITGIVSEDGLLPVSEYINHEEYLKELDENWETIAPHFLDYYYTLPKEKHHKVARIIREHYLGTKPINAQNIVLLARLAGDRFVVDGEKAARLHAKSNRSPVWFYYYTYRAAQSLTDFLTNSTTNFGVCHSDDSHLVIENNYIDPTTTKEDLAMQKEMLDFWESVASKGTPDFGPEWLPLDPTDKEFHFLHIKGPQNYNMDKNDNLVERQFWNTIDFQENTLFDNLNKDEL